VDVSANRDAGYNGDEWKCKSVAHSVDEKIRDKLMHGVRCKKDGTNALADESKTRPCSTFNQVPRFEEYKMKRRGIQDDIKSGLYVCNDIFFGNIDVPAVHDADDIWFAVLQSRYRCPENTFATAPGITIRVEESD